jgi:hypothetical protein
MQLPSPVVSEHPRGTIARLVGWISRLAFGFNPKEEAPGHERFLQPHFPSGHWGSPTRSKLAIPGDAP